MATTHTSQLRVTIVADNIGFDSHLKQDWGFSALIETSDHTVLFDTGAKGGVLLANLKKLGHSVDEIDAVVISHDHWDHIGGLKTLVRKRKSRDSLPLYLPVGCDPRLGKRQAPNIVYPVPGQEIVPGIQTTGTLDLEHIPEQSLILSGANGPVLITGCAHPGIESIITEAGRICGAKVDFALGGFHLFRSDDGERETVYDGLEDFGSLTVAPSHCTGEAACQEISSRFGERYAQSGAGKIFELGAAG